MKKTVKHFLYPAFIILIAITVLLFGTGCATKGTIEKYYDEQIAPRFVRTNNEITDTAEEAREERRQIRAEIEEINNTLPEITARLDQFDARLVAWDKNMRELEGSIKDTFAQVAKTRDDAETNIEQISSVNEQVNNLWKDLAKLEKNFNQFSDTMNNLTDEHSLALQNLGSNLANQKTRFNTDLGKINKNLTDRIDTTNKELNIFRNQMLSKFNDMESALDKLGESVYSIVKLQRKQFEDVVQQYDESMRKIEILLPETTLGESATPEPTPVETPLEGETDDGTTQ